MFDQGKYCLFKKNEFEIKYVLLIFKYVLFDKYLNFKYINI